MRRIIIAVMMMSVKDPGGAQLDRQTVQHVKTIAIAGGRFMQHQNIGLFLHQGFVIAGKNRAAVTQAVALSIFARFEPAVRFVILGAVEPPVRPGRIPDGAPEYAAQSGNAHAMNIHDSAMQVTVSQFGIEPIVINSRAIGVMVTVNPPDVGHLANVAKNFMQGLMSLDVAKKNDS